MAKVKRIRVPAKKVEPTFNSGVEITNEEMVKSLEWYNNNYVKKDAVKFATDYCNDVLSLNVKEKDVRLMGNTFGWLCRILSNGGIITEQNKIWFDKKLDDLNNKLADNVDEPTVITKKDNTPSIQDRIKEKTSFFLGELEGQIDDFIDSEFKDMPSPLGLMDTLGVKNVHTKFILEWIKKHRSNFTEAIETTDKDLKEAWSCYSKSNLKKLISYCDQVILDCQKISEKVTSTRKPRKRKEKTPEQLVAKITVCEEDKILNIKSEPTTGIIGASSIWIFNTKNKKLGVYHAADIGGLSVKGTNITNYAESKSIQKILRKPKDVLPDIVKGGKVFLRNIMDNLTTKGSELNGKLNKDTVIVKIVK